MPRPSKYSPELRERAVRMVQDHASEYPSQWAAMRSVAEKARQTIVRFTKSSLFRVPDLGVSLPQTEQHPSADH